MMHVTRRETAARFETTQQANQIGSFSREEGRFIRTQSQSVGAALVFLCKPKRTTRIVLESQRACSGGCVELDLPPKSGCPQFSDSVHSHLQVCLRWLGLLGWRFRSSPILTGHKTRNTQYLCYEYTWTALMLHTQ